MATDWIILDVTSTLKSDDTPRADESYPGPAFAHGTTRAKRIGGAPPAPPGPPPTLRVAPVAPWAKTGPGQLQRMRPNTAGWATGRRLQKDNLSLGLEQNNLLVYANYV
jgi:hypothetical protein